tara:strand:- start:770 stop:1687 length:918 start_codon:yes stop_codon:yes gene_type:complete
MSGIQVLLVAGTHGNELNAPWLFHQWKKNSKLIQTNGIKVLKEIGNPEAIKRCSRYLDRDLNRSFKTELLSDFSSNQYEVKRAQELIFNYGPEGKKPCQIALDFHSTTAAMGCSLVVYGRRSNDLAFAALIQHRLGLPIYLHEGDLSQKGFLVESWPCGLVVEIGPVPQGLLHSKVINQTKLTLEVSLEEISKVQNGTEVFPQKLIIYRHLESIDFPRDINNYPKAIIHEKVQNSDWIPLKKEQPLFIDSNSKVVSRFDSDDSLVPVFINEAAYLEKNIAMSLTKREVWQFQEEWGKSFRDLIST